MSLSPDQRPYGALSAVDIIARQGEQPRKFLDPQVTLDGQPRARVGLGRLRTLWFNTGTLCNLSCEHCYIESSPSNDRLSYLTREEVAGYLREISTLALPTREIGFTGGEPFMNPQFLNMLQDCLEAGYQVLVLTNAMRPMLQHEDALLALRAGYGEQLIVRVSVDHYRPEVHQRERGRGSWRPMLRGLKWLSHHGFRVHVAGRTRWGETEVELRQGFQNLFDAAGVALDAYDPAQLTLFPEMDETAEVPEITTACWGILGVDPDAMMCASARMVVKRRGAPAPIVVACTLLPYDPGFEFGTTLQESLAEVALNHPHCARFCVLGGGSCSG